MAGKYVIHEAKIKCSLCSKQQGKLMVTSNQILLQNKFWATKADKEKPNLIFKGNCLKFSKNPPPCIAVISVANWQNTADSVTIDGEEALLESSIIMCNTGGVPITIEDTTQKDTPTNLPELIPLEEIPEVTEVSGPFEVKNNTQEDG